MNKLELVNLILVGVIYPGYRGPPVTAQKF
jgi:hypothetical protein